MSPNTEVQDTLPDYKSMLLSFEDAITAIDLDGTIVYWNKAAEQLYGFRASEVIGHKVDENYPGPWASKLALSVLVFDSGENVAAIETSRMMKYGAMLTVSVRFSPMRGEDGQLIGLSAVSRDITKFREAELARADLSRRLLSLEDEVAKQIASNIHDGVLQELIAKSLRLKMLMQSMELASVAKPLESIEASISETIHQLRSIMFEVAPSALEYGGVLEALGEHFDRLHDVSLDTELILEDLPCPSMSSQNASTLYRIGREAITNALKHARAKTIRVSIVDAYGGLQMVVSDDGIGMTPQRAQRSHFGIQTMRDRSEQDGGHLEFTSDSVSGTKVTVWIPRLG